MIYLRAAYSGLIVIQGGIGALAFDPPWNVLVPLSLAAAIAALAEVTGKVGAAQTLADARATIRELQGELIISQGQADALQDAAEDLRLATVPERLPGSNAPLSY